MKNAIVLTFLVVALLAAYSCKHETNCPAFSDDDMLNFPYAHVDSLIFVNAASEELALLVTELNTSNDYSYTCSDLNGICGCERFAEVKVSTENGSEEFTLLKLLIQSSDESQRFYYSLFGYSFEFDFENDGPYVDLMPEIDSVGDFTVSDSVFTGVYRATNFNFNETNVQRVYFNKTSGIIRFDEYIGAASWSLKLDEK